MNQTYKYIPEGLLLLQEARKTVTAGAAFRPFPGDDWQNAGSCHRYLPTACCKLPIVSSLPIGLLPIGVLCPCSE